MGREQSAVKAVHDHREAYASPLGAAVHDATAKRPQFGKSTLSPAVSAQFTKRGRINLRAVAEVLEENGLDPTEELVKIVQSGKLPLDIQARVLNELVQYIQPKLKSVDVKMKVAATSFDINDEQAKRIAEEFLKANDYQALLA